MIDSSEIETTVVVAAEGTSTTIGSQGSGGEGTYVTIRAGT
jgi:hypothetical protein